jgi:primosomal protein N' (replication factor Y)
MIRSLKNYDRDLFYKSELDSRKSEFMPPFSKLVAVIISGYLINEVLTAVKVLQKNIVKDINVQVFGPAPAPIEVLNNRYRYRFLLIYKKTFKIQNYIKNWLSPFKSFKKIDIIIDVDPINFL